MGQLSDKMNEATVHREPFDENSNNGLILSDIYLPEELITQILHYVDVKSLLNCQLVCKRWNRLLQNYVWWKKAESIMENPLPKNENIPWCVFYAICKHRPFERNLLKNHSGKEGASKHWKVTDNGGDKWAVETPPVGVPPLPLDQDPELLADQRCFVTSFSLCSKYQCLNFKEMGILPYVMDKLQPSIVVNIDFFFLLACLVIYNAITIMNFILIFSSDKRMV